MDCTLCKNKTEFSAFSIRTSTLKNDLEARGLTLPKRLAENFNIHVCLICAAMRYGVITMNEAGFHDPNCGCRTCQDKVVEAITASFKKKRAKTDKKQKPTI